MVFSDIQQNDFHRVNAQVIGVGSCVCFDVDFGVGFDIRIWCRN